MQNDGMTSAPPPVTPGSWKGLQLQCKGNMNHFWPDWLVPSVCDGHSFCVNLRLQPWAASVPLFPLQPWNNSTSVKRANNSILWDKGKGQSFERKKKPSANLFFFFCLLIFSVSQSKGNWKKPLLFPSFIPDVSVFLKSPSPLLSAGLNYFLGLENPFSLLTPFTFLRLTPLVRQGFPSSSVSFLNSWRCSWYHSHSLIVCLPVCLLHESVSKTSPAYPGCPINNWQMREWEQE